MSERPPVKITLTIPAEVAAVIKHHGRAIFDNLVIELQQAEEYSEARREAREADYRDRIAAFNCKRVQAYRLFRRIRSNFPTTAETYREIGRAFEWSPTVVQDVVSGRRKKVTAYVQSRHKRIAWSCARDGWSNARIAERLNLTDRQVQVLLAEVRSEIREGKANG